MTADIMDRIYNPKGQCPDPDKLPTLTRGAKGPDVRLLQELLTLVGSPAPTIDGDFGPATDLAAAAYIKGFLPALTYEGAPIPDLQRSVVDEVVWARLLSKMHEALTLPAETPYDPRRLNDAIISYGNNFLRAQAREVGGENRGPWVRLFMDGNEGTEWAWCAGFATFVVGMAARATGLPKSPVLRSFGCVALGQWATANGLFIPGGKKPVGLKAGDLFLCRSTKRPWVHIGIVSKVGSDYITTIEGNSNETGSREGVAVVKLVRAYTNLDFISVRA